MQLSELKLVSASNIIRLRTQAGLTQAQLGAMLNYSDKTVSKWERGEAIPDAYVLTRLAEIFGVSVDYLLSSHDDWVAPPEDSEQMKKPRYSESRIIMLVTVSVWMAFLTAFVALCLFDIFLWEIFLVAVFASLLVLIVLFATFRRRRYLELCIGLLVLSFLSILFFVIPQMRLWQVIALSIPAELIVFLSFHIRIQPGEKDK